MKQGAGSRKILTGLAGLTGKNRFAREREAGSLEARF
jgi:hypothetical protein